MLDKSEFVSLRTLIQFPGRFRPTQNAEATREYLELCTSEEAQPGSAWYKMPFVGQLKDITKGTPGLMLLRLKKPPALFSFGKIVAVDQFIGNNDRFNAMGELVNEGNLLFQQIDGTISPVGLDFFQAQGQAANLLVGPPDWGKNARGKYEYIWGGENLLHENNIRFFADRAIESLNAYFSKQNIRRITLFGPDDALEFANGMKEGIRELKQFLLMRGLPEGVRIRMDKLGWPYNANLPARPVKPAPLFKPARPGAKRPGPTIAGTLLAPVREGTRMAA